MKISINAESNGEDSIKSLVDYLTQQGIAAKPEDIKTQVWSEKSQKFIDFDPSQIKFVYQK